MTDDAPLAPEEEEICGCVAANRMNLHRFLGEFTLAVQLFELLERGGGPPSVGVSGGVFIQFRMIAAKEGALSIYHFGNSLGALRKQVVMCPRTRNLTDTAKLKEAFGLFNKYFPHANNIRHAIAHAGEVWASPAKAREHRQKEHYASAGIASAAGGFRIAVLYERTYSVGWEGKVFEVHMDVSTIQKLTEVSNLAASAFPQVPIGT
jgi:hypothetical protein